MLRSSESLGLFAAALFVLSPRPALAADVKTPWVVLPIQCPAPPPGDPTLLRLTRELASALHDAVGGDIRIVSRDERDDRCPDEEGVCPRDIAGMLGADRVLGLVLARGYKSMHVRVYRDRAGLEREGELDCRWEGGSVSCETAALAALLGSEESSPPLDKAKVEADFKAFRPKLERCRGLPPEEGEAPPPIAVDDGWVSFRVRPDGHVTDVRINPRELEGSSVARCMARTVESFSAARFAGTKPVAFRFPIAERAPAEVKKPAKAAKKVKGAKPAKGKGSAKAPPAKQ